MANIRGYERDGTEYMFIDAEGRQSIDELKSAMYFSADGNAVYFERGALGSSDGKTSSSTTRLRTGFLPRGTVSVTPKTGYKLMLFAYQADGTYVGVYNGTEFAKSGSWKTAGLTIPNKTYLYRLVFANTSDSTIVASDGKSNLEMVIAADQEMDKSGYAADAAAVGKIFKSLTDHGPVNFLNPLSKYYTATELTGGVTFTYNEDGSWAVSGTASSSSYHDIIWHKPVAPGVYRVKLNGGSMTLRIYIEFPAGTSDTVIDAGRDKLITVPSNAVSISARLITVSGTTYSTTVKYEMYRIADADLYQNGVVVSTGDTTDRTLEIEFCLSNYGFCRLQKGVYYTSGVTMPDNTALYGDGWDAILALSGSSAGNAITLGSGCTVKNMQIRGEDEPLSMPPPSSDGNRNGIMLDGTNKSPKPLKGVIDGCWIHDFTGGGIRLQYTGYPSNGGMAVSNCDIERNYAGIFNAEDSEFHKITNCSMTQNRYGAICNGANNLFSCCNFSSNINGFLMDNESGEKVNTAHGGVVGSTFMHNNSRTIIIKGMVSGFVFDGCNIDGNKYNDDTFSVPLLFKNSTNIVFSGCNFMNWFEEIEVDGQGETDGGTTIGNFILFSGSSFRPEFTTVTVKNGAVLSQVKFDNCYAWDGTAFDPTAN